MLTPSEPQTTTHVHVRPSRPSVVLDRKCAHCGSLNCDSTQIVLFANTPACNTVEKVSMWCLFCCDAAEETQTCYLPLRILFERDPAVLDAGAPLRCCRISRKMVRPELVINIWLCAPDFCQFFFCLHVCFLKTVLEYFSFVTANIFRIPCICDDFQQHRQCWTLEV